MRTRTLSASLPALRPRVPILAAALLLVVLAVAGLAAPMASAQTPEPISANAATVRVTVPAGASLLGWFGAPTTSSAISAATTTWSRSGGWTPRPPTGRSTTSPCPTASA